MYEDKTKSKIWKSWEDTVPPDIKEYILKKEAQKRLGQIEYQEEKPKVKTDKIKDSEIIGFFEFLSLFCIAVYKIFYNIVKVIHPILTKIIYSIIFGFRKNYEKSQVKYNRKIHGWDDDD